MISVEKLFMIWKKIEWIRNDFYVSKFCLFYFKVYFRTYTFNQDVKEKLISSVFFVIFYLCS